MEFIAKMFDRDPRSGQVLCSNL